jgi:hypothetical protein
MSRQIQEPRRLGACLKLSSPLIEAAADTQQPVVEVSDGKESQTRGVRIGEGKVIKLK